MSVCVCVNSLVKQMFSLFAVFCVWVLGMTGLSQQVVIMCMLDVLGGGVAMIHWVPQSLHFPFTCGQFHQKNFLHPLSTLQGFLGNFLAENHNIMYVFYLPGLAAALGLASANIF